MSYKPLPKDLPPAIQLVVNVMRQENVSQSELAERMGVPLQNVTCALRRLRPYDSLRRDVGVPFAVRALEALGYQLVLMAEKKK